MLDEKTFKKELVRMWDSLRGDRYKGYCGCSGLSCNRCPLHDIGCREPMNTFKMIEAVEKWSKEHPQKHKISQLEYDILKAYSDDHFYYFYESDVLKLLLKKDCFKGANEKMNIEHYFNNCEVKEDV